jgi:anti-sigma factor (TIGR02949 family)
MDSTHNSLDCEQIFALLSEYLDAELPPEVCERIAAHIDGCDPCVEFIESVRKTAALCRQYRPNAVPPPLAAQVRQDLRRAYDEFLSRKP